MFDAGICHYYVNKLSRLKNGDFIIPICWVKFQGKVYCDAFSITFNDKNKATIVDTETSLICTDDFAENYLDLEQGGAIPNWSESTLEAGHLSRMPNPIRESPEESDQVVEQTLESLRSTHTDPVRVEDKSGKATHFCIHVNGGRLDNPMQSEVTGHIGGKGNHFCRKCEADGTQKQKASDEGYHTLFEVFNSRLS
ncbi:hypothetical protein B0H10DRAFT_1939560 [Mycena sp. CBHHK59/15]|nr:hypothetical protein B0H10DRAFT_1939560 [Mycena sp. CBHHK59/15]